VYHEVFLFALCFADLYQFSRAKLLTFLTVFSIFEIPVLFILF
jgi:hypothetical protein